MSFFIQLFPYLCETSPTLRQIILVVWAAAVVCRGRKDRIPVRYSKANGPSASHVISRTARRPALMQRRGSSHDDVDEGFRANGLRCGVALRLFSRAALHSGIAISVCCGEQHSEVIRRGVVVSGRSLTC